MGAEASAESSLVGQTFDNKFRIIRLIGRGGMGEVFEAEHTELGKRVAVKLMLEKYTGDEEAVKRFRRESLAASRIGDPHIIHVMDIGTAPDGRAYVVMELLDGMPLSKLIEDHGHLPPQRALRIMRQVLRAVGAAHAKGIVHRDLKPDNIFLQRKGDVEDFVKLLDFGISKFVDPELQAAATKLTTTGVVMGTPLYMAPEQAMGAEIDHHADLYACGVILYEMLAGKPPFEGNTYAVLVAKMLTTDAPLLSTVREGLAPKLVAAVHKALEKDPKNRWSSADAFVAALPSASSASGAELAQTLPSGEQRAVTGPLLGSTTQQTPASQSRRNALLIAGALVLGIGAASAAIIVMTRQQPTQQTTQTTQTTQTPPTPTAMTQPELPPAPPPENTPENDVETPPATPLERAAEGGTQTGTGTGAEAPHVQGGGVIMLDVTPANATVTIDGKVYPANTGVTVVAGAHEVRAELAGYKTVEKTVTVEPRATQTVTLALTKVTKRTGETRYNPFNARPKQPKGPAGRHVKPNPFAVPGQ